MRRNLSYNSNSRVKGTYFLIRFPSLTSNYSVILAATEQSIVTTRSLSIETNNKTEYKSGTPCSLSPRYVLCAITLLIQLSCFLSVNDPVYEGKLGLFSSACLHSYFTGFDKFNRGSPRTPPPPPPLQLSAN